MSYKRPRPCLNSMFYFTICLFYTIKQQQQKDFFFSASRIFKLAAAAQRWKVDELRGGGSNNRSGNKSSGWRGWGCLWTCCLLDTHSSEGYTTILPKPFIAAKSGVRLR